VTHYGNELNIELTKRLPGKKREVLLLLAKVNTLAEFAPVVVEAKVLSKDAQYTITSWHVKVDGLPIRWEQKSDYDAKTGILKFDIVRGDLEEFAGEWRIKKSDDHQSVVLELSLKARLGIPFFENVVRDELESRLQKIFHTIMESLEERLITERYAREGDVLKKKPKGFAVMGHPYNFQHLIKIFKVFKPNVQDLSQDFLLKIFELAPSYKGAEIKNFKSKAGVVVDGYFVMCPIIPDMAVLTPDIVLPKVLEGCRIAERLGAGVLALGGFTSIVGERFLNVLKSKVKMPITTGNTFTVAMALAGVRKAAKLLNVDLRNTRAAIIGGTGDIGSACARVLNLEVKELVITGRTLSTLGQLKEELTRASGREVEVSTDNNQAAKHADIIIAAASSTEPVVDIHNIKAGAIVCDVGYPKNISYHSKHRDDLLVFSGGLCQVPMDFNIGIDVGLPSPRMLYGCWAEAIILSLEERFENFSEGKGLITVEKVDWIYQAALKHGFDVAPFYWGNQMMDEEAIAEIRNRLKSARA
jgi:fatty aldehyde-generating acyl-ACP reductase